LLDNGGAEITSRGVCWSTGQNPTVADSKTEDGTGTGSFTSSVTNLQAGTMYYLRAYAINSVGTSYGDEVSFSTTGEQTMTDGEGNIYKVITIGTQTWMAENLNATKYPDGTSIPHITDNTEWSNLGDTNSDDAYCYYNNDESLDYGVLYTYAAATQVCPTGWHLPSSNEWDQLKNFLIDNGHSCIRTGGYKYYGKAFANQTGWDSSDDKCNVGNDPNTNNSSGFSGLPGGFRYQVVGDFRSAGRRAFWWNSGEAGSDGYGRTLDSHDPNLESFRDKKSNGFSVRCVKD
jgi:uncharacterized protein (TIGR02145 family)